MSLLSFLIYVPLQIAFMPLAIVGVILVAYRQLVVSKRLGVSQTAIEVLNGRWTMHIFGLRKDPATAKLAASLPNTSTTGLWLALFPLWIKFKLSGKLFLYPRIPEVGNEGLGEIIVVRTLHFDRIIERAIPEVEQFVVMGAGYDTRAYGDFRRDGVIYYELDQPNVQKHKRTALLNAEIDSDHVRFVSVDFNTQNAIEQLVITGFAPSKKTLFLLEGVTLYLTEDDVRKTIREVRDYAPAGSILLADFYADRFIDISKPKAVQKTLDYTNERLGFGLPLATGYEQVLRDFVESENMSLGEAHFMGSSNDNGPFMVVAELNW
ncbi:MAG: class I SAM-dependent methyltransferase [Rhodobacteraceae bacterium]|nr:class I SAM-dependent methyltransferase [Paracoccaceae bacterium]